MINYWGLYFLMAFGFQPTEIEQQDVVLIDQFEVKGMQYFSTDHLGNIYTIIGDEIRLVDRTGRKLMSYSNPLQGKIKTIDTFNPMRILLHHDLFFSISFLDNQLNPNRSVFEPSQHGYMDVQLVSSMDNDRIWFYDQTLDRLILWHLGREQEMATSLTITQLLRKESQPARLISRMDRTYLLIPGAGIMEFNQLGAFIKIHRVGDIGDYLQVRNRLLMYRQGNTLVKYHQDTFETWELVLPGNPDQIRMENQWLFCRYGETIKVFEVKL
jgi:hypothetical protein